MTIPPLSLLFFFITGQIGVRLFGRLHHGWELDIVKIGFGLTLGDQGSIGVWFLGLRLLVNNRRLLVNDRRFMMRRWRRRRQVMLMTFMFKVIILLLQHNHGEEMSKMR